MDNYWLVIPDGCSLGNLLQCLLDDLVNYAAYDFIITLILLLALEGRIGSKSLRLLSEFLDLCRKI